MPRTPVFTTAQLDRYDAMMDLLERRLFPGTRRWLCGRARGSTLEIAVGTGLNIPHYPADVSLTAIDLNPSVLPAARRVADQLGRSVGLSAGDARHLPFEDASFDAVVCTFALCAVPSDAQALTEMVRVTRPGGSVLIADHVVSTSRLIRGTQRALERITIPRAGEHFTRRPVLHLDDLAVTVVASERVAAGAIERVHAVRD
jgi:ubiquinone/menaquinone biosynthesis C-methylase UbiE